MSIVLRIQTQGDVVNTVRSLNRIKKKMPQMTRLGMRRWGNILEKDMKTSARNARIGKFTGTLQGKGIRYEQGKRSDKGQLFIRLYGVYLDSMRPHFVNVTRRRTTLLTWAKRARSMSIRMKANEVSKGERRAFGKA